MSCLGNSYLPQPPREWNRFENPCAYSDIFQLPNTETIFVPYLNKNLTKTEYIYLLELYYKGNILQYKNNSANLTQKQRYAQIAKGMWTNRTTTWASQSESYSNPNTKSLKRVNYGTITTNGTNANNLAITCPTPIAPVFNRLPSNNGSGGAPTPIVIPPPPPPPPNPTTNQQPFMPPYVAPGISSETVIADGGTLLCNVVENICTGEILQTTKNNFFNSTTDSDVPGKPSLLWFNPGFSTFYPKVKRNYSSGNTKWPINAKIWGTTNYVSSIPNQ
jgi:hypothetical protein